MGFPSSINDGQANEILVQPISVNIGAINNATSLAVTLTVPGAALGMCALVNPRETLDNGLFLVHSHVLAANQVQVVLYNNTAAPITPGVQVFDVALLASVPALTA